MTGDIKCQQNGGAPAALKEKKIQYDNDMILWFRCDYVKLDMCQSLNTLIEAYLTHFADLSVDIWQYDAGDSQRRRQSACVYLCVYVCCVRERALRVKFNKDTT